MAPAKKASRKQAGGQGKGAHHGVHPDPCNKEFRGAYCGGKLVTDYKRHFDRDQATRLVIPDSEHKKFFCEKCGGEVREAIGARRYYDPENKLPLMSEYSVKAAKDPYNRVS